MDFSLTSCDPDPEADHPNFCFQNFDSLPSMDKVASAVIFLYNNPSFVYGEHTPKANLGSDQGKHPSVLKFPVHLRISQALAMSMTPPL